MLIHSTSVLSVLLYFGCYLSIAAPIIAPRIAISKHQPSVLITESSDTSLGPSTSRRWSYKKDVAVSSAFALQFKCEADTTFCEKAQGAFQRAAQRISSTFSFVQTVSVDLAMFLPCGSATPDFTCSESTTLGFATPTQRIPVVHHDDNLTYMYPTSVLKQTDVDGVDQVKWPRFDILARFNAAYSWYFAEDGPSISTNQRDLELVATHEFMHGLGYGDDLLMSLQFFTNSSMLMPYYTSAPDVILAPATDEGVSYNAGLFYNFSPPSIWNRFTYLADRSLIEYYKVIMNAFNTMIKSFRAMNNTMQNTNSSAIAYSADDVFNTLILNDTTQALFESLYQYGTTAKSLVFKSNVWPPQSNDGKYIPTSNQILETGIKPYLDGSSLAHVQLSANSTPDFLMVYRTGPRSFADAIAATGAPSSGIGPQTRDVMIALGLAPVNGSAISRKSYASVIPQARNINPDTRGPPPNFPIVNNTGGTSEPVGKSSASLVEHAHPIQIALVIMQIILFIGD